MQPKTIIDTKYTLKQAREELHKLQNQYEVFLKWYSSNMMFCQKLKTYLIVCSKHQRLVTVVFRRCVQINLLTYLLYQRFNSNGLQRAEAQTHLATGLDRSDSQSNPAAGPDR